MRMWWNGRHATLRGWWALARVSSSLTIRTMTDVIIGFNDCYCVDAAEKHQETERYSIEYLF